MLTLTGHWSRGTGKIFLFFLPGVSYTHRGCMVTPTDQRKFKASNTSLYRLFRFLLRQAHAAANFARLFRFAFTATLNDSPRTPNCEPDANSGF